MKTVAETLEARFGELGIEPSSRARAMALNEDPATFSKIVNGAMILTGRRAKAWADHLYRNPPDPAAAAALAKALLDAIQPAARGRSVGQFFDRIVAEGGAVSAERMSELLTILRGDEIDKVLICCEYRDLPRAGPDAKYEEMVPSLGAAIAHGIHFAMFQPFGAKIAVPSPSGLAAATYMVQVQAKCIAGYQAFKDAAIEALAKRDNVKRSDEVAWKKRKSEIDGRIRLYERRGDDAYIGSGFQAKLFYIRYSTKAGEGVGKRHERILQWVSTPKRDLLVYRGEKEVSPEAIKDGFFPVAHFFDAENYLPRLSGDSDYRAVEGLRDKPGGAALPLSHQIWQSYG